MAVSIAEYLALPLLSPGGGCVIVATAPNTAAILEELERKGLPLDPLRQQGRLTLRPAEEYLEGFMRDGVPDQELFFETVGKLVDRGPGFFPSEDLRRDGGSFAPEERAGVGHPAGGTVERARPAGAVRPRVRLRG